MGNSQSMMFLSFASLHDVGVEFVQKSPIHSERDNTLPINVMLQLIVEVEFVSGSHIGIA